MNYLKLSLICLAITLSTAVSYAQSEGDSTKVAPEKTMSDDEEKAALAKASQNPLAAMYSVPLQNNTNYAYGVYKRDQNVFNIQPVLPFHLGKKVNLITRTIIPIITQPSPKKDESNTNIGDVLLTAWLSPSKSNVFSWGAGPVMQIPTNSGADEFGSREFGIGPSAVALVMLKKLVMGFVVQNIWTFGTIKENKFLVQWFVNFNLPKAWYLVTAPIVTANWNKEKGQQWVVPFGLGVGKIVKLGKLPLNLSAHFYYNAVRSDVVGPWASRFQVQFLFPTNKKKKEKKKKK